jgi:hypothetical protein
VLDGARALPGDDLRAPENIAPGEETKICLVRASAGCSQLFFKGPCCAAVLCPLEIAARRSEAFPEQEHFRSGRLSIFIHSNREFLGLKC